MTKNNAVGWFEIYVSDIQRAKTFYEKVFQTQLEKLPSTENDLEMWTFPGDHAANGANGTICKMAGFEPGKNSTVVYFNCQDCAVEEKRAKENGGKVHKSKHSIGPHGHIALVYDSEGNMIGLHSMK